MIETQATQQAKAMNCPTCEAKDFIKYGTCKDTQIYWCKSCKRRFSAKSTMPGRRMPPEQVGAALSMFYSGLSVAETSRKLSPIFDISPPSKATIYEWVVDYTRLAKDKLRPHKAKTGLKWVADEMVLKIGGKKYWNWNVMDADTRYLLAAHLSPTRTTRDAEAVFKQALRNACRMPRVIVTDRLAAYVDGIERVFGADAKHIQSGGIRAEVNSNLSERLQGTIRRRSKVMRGMQRKDTAQLVMDGWTIYYNHFRPHEALRGKTPAEAAKIERPFKNWEDVARQDVRPYSTIRVREFKDDTFKRRRVVISPLRQTNPFRRRAMGL